MGDKTETMLDGGTRPGESTQAGYVLYIFAKKMYLKGQQETYHNQNRLTGEAPT